MRPPDWRACIDTDTFFCNHRIPMAQSCHDIPHAGLVCKLNIKLIGARQLWRNNPR